MDITTQSLNNLKTTYSALFSKAVADAAKGEDSLLVKLKDLFGIEPSTSSANIYAWAENLAGFREWVGDRQFKSLSLKKYEVKNLPFEMSFELKASDIEDDQHKILTIPIKAAGASWTELKGELILNAFLTNPKAFDGKNLFASDRKYGKNTIGNMVTTALSLATFTAAITAMASWKFANNKPVKSRANKLFVGPKQYAAAFAIVGTEKLNGGENNPYFKNVEIVVVDDMVGKYENYWILINTTSTLPPVIMQLRKEPKPNMTTDPILVEREGKAIFMADGRAAAAPTMPHFFYGGLVAEG